MFAVSAEMAGPIERARRNMAAVALEREAAKSALSRLEAQHNSILTTIADAIILADNEWRVTYANPRACDILGADLDGAVGARLDGGSFGRIAERCVEAARAGDGIRGSTKLEDRDGEDIHRIYLARFSRVRARDGSDTGTLIVLEDVTREELLKKELAAQARNLEKAVAEKTRELEAANASLAKLARTDSLTGLPNRRTFEETLVGEIERASRYGYTTGVVMVDVDDFKSVNDRFGHQVGDSVLRHAAMILSKSVRSTDAVARFGGDEFSILLPQAGIAECEAVARRISENLLIENASASRVRGVQLSLSVGWAADGGRSAETLLARADEMMYDSKASKKARVPQDAARR